MSFHKTCKKCEQTKPVEEFYRNHRAADRRQSQCKDCRRKYLADNRDSIREWQKEARKRREGGEVRHRRKWHPLSTARAWLVLKYGMTEADYESLLLFQGSACAICHKPAGDTSLAIDHHHETGIVRGLLCSPCNSGIGMLGDSPANLARAIAYIVAGGVR